MQKEHEKMKDNWTKFEEEFSKIISPEESKNKLDDRVSSKNAELINLFENEFEREIVCLSGDAKVKKQNEKPTKIQEIKDRINVMESEQVAKDQVFAAINDDTSGKKYAERAREREVERILLLRRLKLEKEKEWLEKSKTARASEPVLYRSHGPNSYSASKRPKSGNSHQKETDPKPWNAWQVEKSQFLLSASRSIGVLRASSKSDGFRYDAFQPVS